ncbi:YeiH family protein [Flavobacterium restrictum]|uniref:Putative sulfate exporter family transporter n=1 Tax=Flavobacterium restrictum TaxID=2594428 RepID=A0A553ECZ9_9FLAO|nr:putative sulfate exporter family transporter [Flavobacterium restrictum]TRX42865.1 putative sulfate exporter family transporter [Flavobacterium restrictum]
MVSKKAKLNDKPSFHVLQISEKSRKIVFFILLLLCCSGWITPPLALFLGAIVANLTGHPYLHLNHKATTILLQVSVVGLGFGMNVHSAVLAGKEGFLFTIISIISTLFLGYFLGKWMGIDKKVAHLISCGTAICGGSAIAAIAPVIKSDEKQTSVALGVIFILNSVALFLFPAIGHLLNLSQKQFGFWCAIAIHDTSSVVGAASKYGIEALQIATTVKLARALWIIPVALVTAVVFKNKSNTIKIPYFIGFFIVAMVLNTYVPQTALVATYLVAVAKIGLTVTLFLIGAGLHRTVLFAVGLKPLLQGVLLWASIAIATLLLVLYLM